MSPILTLVYYINIQDTHGNEIYKIAIEYKIHSLIDKDITDYFIIR